LASQSVCPSDCPGLLREATQGSTVWWSPAGQAFMAWLIGPGQAMGLGVP
jgi:hypothetical protein